MSEPTVPPPPSYTPPPPPPSSGGPAGPGSVSPNRTIMVVLSYLWILALVPLLAEKEDQEVQWHARNGLLILAGEIALWIVLSIFSVGMASFDFGCTGCMMNSILWVVVLVVRIVAIVKGVNGQRLVIPGLSQFADKPWF